ncbi:MAG: hypothetical protein L0271_19115 [Gemmatimonadetes bacterium]|nr:hypothetical protein [Gemmatimonadota bacterium]
MIADSNPAMHAGLAAGAWSRLSLAEQLTNVGSEADRAIRAWRSGRRDRFDRALARALELFDLTAADERSGDSTCGPGSVAGVHEALE